MIKVIGIDAAFANVGLAAADIDERTGTIHAVTHMQLCSTERHDKKIVRKSSDDLRRAVQLTEAIRSFCATHQPFLAFAEVPSGSQSASAARALGIAVGVLAGCPVRIIEVSPLEVKTAAVGSKTATKPQMIAWATKRWPDANWLHQRGNPKAPLTADNEHLADACGAIQAGINTQEFKLFLDLVRRNETSSPDDRGPAPRSEPTHGVSVGLDSLARRPVTARRH